MGRREGFRMNSKGAQSLLKSAEVAGVVLSHAQRVASSAGAGYAARPGTRGRTRSRAWVAPETIEAMRDNAENATLLRTPGRL